MHVTLITDSDFFEFTPSVPRSLVDPHKGVNVRVRHRVYLRNPKTKIYTTRMESIQVTATKKDKHNAAFVYETHVYWTFQTTRKCVTLTTGKEIPYDILVLATGSSYSLPFKV